MKALIYRTFSICLLLSICCLSIFAQKKKGGSLDNYIVKENLVKNDKLAIIACDSAERPMDNINGHFLFTINGFKQQLLFSEGVAITPQEIDKSSFVFLKHENAKGSHVKLYYVIKSDDGLNPIKVNWLVLLIIPLGIIVLAGVYKRLIVIAILVLCGYFYFNHHQGLSFEGAFETIYQGIKQIIN